MWMILAALVLSTSAPTPIVVAPAESLMVTGAGRGEVVVLLPGLSGSAFAYRATTPPLRAAGLRTLVIEPLGVGMSSRPPKADYSLAAQARRVAVVLDTLGAERAIVVAHGLSASVAYRLALLRPDLVRGIVSIEGGPHEGPGSPSLRLALRFAPLLEKIGGKGFLRGQFRRGLVHASYDPGWVTEAVVRGYGVGGERDPQGMLKALRAMAEARETDSLQARLGAIRCPVELLVGRPAHSGGVSDEEIAILRRSLPRFTLVQVERAGHFIQEEQLPAVVASVLRLRDATSPAVTPPAASPTAPRR